MVHNHTYSCNGLSNKRVMVCKNPTGMIIMERVEIWGPEGISQQLEASPLFQRTHITTIPDDLRTSLTSAVTRHTWHTNIEAQGLGFSSQLLVEKNETSSEKSSERSTWETWGRGCESGPQPPSQETMGLEYAGAETEGELSRWWLLLTSLRKKMGLQRWLLLFFFFFQ